VKPWNWAGGEGLGVREKALRGKRCEEWAARKTLRGMGCGRHRPTGAERTPRNERPGTNAQEQTPPERAPPHSPSPFPLCSHMCLSQLGTGFYVEQSTKKAGEFLDRKIALIGKNADNIYDVVMNCRKNLEAIIMTMQGKMSMIQENQNSARAGMAA